MISAEEAFQIEKELVDRKIQQLRTFCDVAISGQMREGNGTYMAKVTTVRYSKHICKQVVEQLVAENYKCTLVEGKDKNRFSFLVISWDLSAQKAS